MADRITELALLLKERDNPQSFDITTAIVIESEPLTLKTGNKIFLSKEYNNLVISASLLKNYSFNADFTHVSGQTTAVNDGGEGASTHLHDLQNFKATVRIRDNIFNVGDLIIVVPIADGNLWYAIDKVGVQ